MEAKTVEIEIYRSEYSNHLPQKQSRYVYAWVFVHYYLLQDKVKWVNLSS